ncbi:MAG: ABC transporter [Micavibrio aeruginosavorus]|uniref:ABC transporter n=1 Tax=Micavibrio aeruginosavorus TaxID=349221 RepID=A0A2W4ZP56_9BACT|nr:MAG: ABC transporter [Micavibrio aeruginosavorus]
MQIRLEKLGFSYQEPLFSGITMTIAETHRVGVIGNNGAGKSTLLKCLTGEVEPTEGTITRPKNIRFGIIEQDIPPHLHSKTLYDVILEAMPEEERDYNSWKVDVALDTFKAPTVIHGKPVKELSGGWQRLALIARTWMGEPDALLLDEPTNHLDLEKIMLLEQWLNEQVRGIPILCISHDRSFLDNCTNTTLFVRPARSVSYPHSFSRAKEQLVQDDRAFAAQREKELREVERLEKSAHELKQTGANFHSDSASKKSAQMAKRADDLRTQVIESQVDVRRDIKLPNSGVHAKHLVELKDININAPDGRQLLHIERLAIPNGERIVLLGLNGTGKSTLVNAIYKAFDNRERAKMDGITITPTAKLGYVDQHLSSLPMNLTMTEYIAGEFQMSRQSVIAKLIETGFPFDRQDQKISKLSGGERSRLYLLALRLAEPNFYIMDEPTNHLDIDGQEQLEAEILKNGAACVLVSHDRSFVANLGTKFLLIQKGKLVEIPDPEVFYSQMAA